MAFGAERVIVSRDAAVQAEFDVGLRAHMLRVYNYMASGLALTGIVAYATAFSGLYAQIAQTPLIWVVMLAPLAFVLRSASASTACGRRRFRRCFGCLPR